LPLHTQAALEFGFQLVVGEFPQGIAPVQILVGIHRLIRAGRFAFAHAMEQGI
jgi:hypothetical protein